MNARAEIASDLAAEIEAVASPVVTTEDVAKAAFQILIDLARDDTGAAVAVADTALDLWAAKAPDLAPTFGSFKDDADWWASAASDTQIATMLHACVMRVAHRGVSSPGARKRAIVALWNGLDPTERAAFLEFADPSPAART